MFKVPSGCVASLFGKSKEAINQWIRMGGVGDKIKRQLRGGMSKVNGLLLAKRIEGAFIASPLAALRRLWLS